MNTPREKRIVVVQNGWVLAGEFVEHDGHVELENATVIQRWGTTKGLGELALSGPTKESVIHPVGRATVPSRAVLFSLPISPVVAAKWPS